MYILCPPVLPDNVGRRPFSDRLEASGEESLLFQWVFLFLFAGEPAPLDVERPFERRQPRERISDRGDGAEE